MSVTLAKTDDVIYQNQNQNQNQNPELVEQKTAPQHLIAERISGEQVMYLHKEMIGDYFFEPQTVKFFNSKVEFGYHLKSTDQVFFITREKSPTGNIGFTVRKFSSHEKAKGVITLTDFNTLTREAAMCELQNFVKKAIN